MRLTALMLDALKRAHRQPLRRVHDDREGKPPWPVAPATIRALERHGLLALSTRLSRQGWRIEEWAVTEAAVTVLFPPPVLLVEQPRFLDRRGYTSRPSRSVDYELVTVVGKDNVPRLRRVAVETVDAPASFVEASRLRHRESMSAQDRARRLRRAA